MRETGLIWLHFSILLLCCSICNVECKKSSPTKEALKSMQFPPCAACKILAKSFTKGIERTSRGKFEGGDSAWEADKLGSYARSEVRLIEIQENLCKEVEHGEAQCHALAEEMELTMEEWWFKHQDTQPDLYVYMCIERMKHCCPKGHYGPKCTQCSGYPDNICNENGKCKGDGTRKGNGQCVCDRGYIGDNCSHCASGYYASYRDNNMLLCSECHSACDGSCNGAGPKDCEKCGKGWKMVKGQGCIDVDECLQNDEHCPGNQLCINKEGTYSCLDCDKACSGCTGDGPDMCIKCAEGYHRKENVCVNSDVFGRKKQENLARYATYLGLCVATYIIVQRNVYAAAVIGLLVGIYISVSEYMIAYSNVQDTSANMDILHADKYTPILPPSRSRSLNENQPMRDNRIETGEFKIMPSIQLTIATENISLYTLAVIRSTQN